jgi:hypothetical protein
VEMNIAGQLLKFDTTSALYLPQGLRHGPRRVTAYRKPYLMIIITKGAGTLKAVRDDAILYPEQGEPEE